MKSIYLINLLKELFEQCSYLRIYFLGDYEYFNIVLTHDHNRQKYFPACVEFSIMRGRCIFLALKYVINQLIALRNHDI